MILGSDMVMGIFSFVVSGQEVASNGIGTVDLVTRIMDNSRFCYT